MDPTKAILIFPEGETEFAIPDIQKGDHIPMVLIRRGKVMAGKPDTVLIMDHGETAKRFWAVPIYRVVTAQYI